jgi:hypothetical protein
LRLISGVVLEEDGVDVFLGSKDGDRDDARPSAVARAGFAS